MSETVISISLYVKSIFLGYIYLLHQEAAQNEYIELGGLQVILQKYSTWLTCL